MIGSDGSRWPSAGALQHHCESSREVRTSRHGRPAALQPHADLVHTLTYDNGKEFAYHQTVAKGLDAQGYFAHPYHSWERGLNENTNGLIRQYLPKGTDFRTLTLERVRSIMDRLNNRPRKCLGFKTPNQLFLEINPPVALTS